MIKEFNFGNKLLKVLFIKKQEVAEGVECDVYEFAGDKSKDLGIIRIKAGHKTPRQKVVGGERTIEGYIAGKGGLEITNPNGDRTNYDGQEGLKVEIAMGQVMQWRADQRTDLEVYEICEPPYQDGRFENLSE